MITSMCTHIPSLLGDLSLKTYMLHDLNLLINKNEDWLKTY